MKVIVDRGVLGEALNLVSGVIASRTPKPVLQCVKLTAEPGALTLVGTDLEAAMRLRIDQVDVQDGGEVLLPADKLTAIVRESIDPTITIETDGESAVITGQDSKFRIFGHGVSEYPAVEPFSGDADFEMPSSRLLELISKTIFATARETSRYAINGVLLERTGKKLTMVATDGRRLAICKGAAANAGSEDVSAISPTKALTLLLRVLSDPEETVKVKMVQNQAHFATESATLTTNLVEGNFPPYKDVIPKEQDRKATFNTDLLASGVRRAALLTNEESKGVKFAFAGDALVLSSRAPEMGESEVTVPAESFTGEAIEIGFNPTFVTDVLKVSDSGTVTLELKAPNKPGTVRIGSDFVYVLMPVSLA